MKRMAISVLSALAGAVIGTSVAGKVTIESVNKERNMSDKHLALFLMMNQWVRVKQEGKNLSTYFEKKGYRKIAIYGMSYAGETLVHELKDTKVNVAYGIDKNADSIYAEVDVIGMEDCFDEVDVVVVTAITFFDEIEEKLQKKIKCPIISLEDILYDI